MNVVICAPDQFPLRRIAHCPTCKRRRRFAGLDAVWYGTLWTCCGCGDRWEDGEMLERPFQRGWRTRSIARAREVWAAGRPRAEWRLWIRTQLASETDAQI